VLFWECSLRTDLANGISDDGDHFASRIAMYGRNAIPETPPESIFTLMWENLQDPTLIILMCAAAVSLPVGIFFEVSKTFKSPFQINFTLFLHLSNLVYSFDFFLLPIPQLIDSDSLMIIQDPNTGWIEGTAILVSVVIVVMVASINDYQKDKQFRELNRKKNDIDVKVIRNGKRMNISINDLVSVLISQEIRIRISE
jgi:Ca2+-transporting ATPase